MLACLSLGAVDRHVGAPSSAVGWVASKNSFSAFQQKVGGAYARARESRADCLTKLRKYVNNVALL